MAATARPKPGEPASSDAAQFEERLRAFIGELDYVYRTLRRSGVGPSDAEDLAQEVFLIAWRRCADFDPSRPVRPWLAGIAFKVAHQHLRRRRPEVLQGVVISPDPLPAPELRPEALDARTTVLRGLAGLSEQYRTVLILRELDGLTVEEIAAQCSASRFTVYTRLRRARAAFAREVERLQLADPARGRATAMAGVLAPAQLLAIEREIPAAPAGLRERVLARLQSEPMPATASAPAPAAGSAPAGAVVVAAAAGGILVAALALLLVLPGDRGQRPGSTAASAAPASPVLGKPASARLPASRPLPPVRLNPAAIAASYTLGAAALPEDLARQLVGFWRFDDAPGSTFATDRSPGGYHCQLRDLDPARAWIPGVVGGAIHLRSGGWLECPQPDLPARPNATLSVAMWVKVVRKPRMHRALAMRPMGGTRGNYFFFGFDNDLLKVHSSGWHGALKVPFRESMGRWVHVAMTYDADQLLKLYVAGAEVARLTARQRRFQPVQGPLRVGAGLSGPYREMGQRFRGALDELMVHERALSAAEIATLARAGAPGRAP